MIKLSATSVVVHDAGAVELEARHDRFNSNGHRSDVQGSLHLADLAWGYIVIVGDIDASG